MSSWRFAIFLTLVLIVWALMHWYVFWRLATLPWITAHSSGRALVLAAVALWLSYPAARILNSWNLETIGVPLEFAAAVWMGVLFLLLAALLMVDLITIGGLLFYQVAPQFRVVALLLAGILSVIGIVQGSRSPVVRNYQVHLEGLPRERDGLTVVAISDLHLGTLKRERWLAKLVDRVSDLKPDLTVIVGDLVDGNVRHVEALLPSLQQLRSPLGVWAVTGNHEYYAGLERSVALLDAAGYKLLRDQWEEVLPGLILAGVDDLTAREQFGHGGDAIAKALTNRPPGRTILLSHSPLKTTSVAAAGVDLMISGHTHAGQIWPFNFLVRIKYPFLAGRYDVDRMMLIVCRGTGTWGPPMRLWRRSEIIRLRLRTVDPKTIPLTARLSQPPNHAA